MNSLKEYLLHLKVAELRDVCSRLKITDKGTKILLVQRIVHFYTTGKEVSLQAFPGASCARKGQKYLLTPSTIMLKGAYKNDLKTRLFFRELIGEHFNFTAFGIDWLNERWMNSNPPTYREFANMWSLEFDRRKKNPAAAKQEWAYIRFVQKYIKNHTDSSREEIALAWKKEHQRCKIEAYSILNI